MKKRIKKYSITYQQITWHYAEVQVKVLWWWVTICTIKDLNDWYPGARAQELLELLEDDIAKLPPPRQHTQRRSKEKHEQE